MSFEPREVGDPGVSGQLTPVTTEAGGKMYIRENMSVAEAMAYGQAALDAKDARIITVTRKGRRFPTYESNPAIERECVESFTKLRAEVELALRGNKTADVQLAKPVADAGGTVTTKVERVTKSIREKYPVQFALRLLWVRIRDWFTPKLRLLHNWLRSL